MIQRATSARISPHGTSEGRTTPAYLVLHEKNLCAIFKGPGFEYGTASRQFDSSESRSSHFPSIRSQLGLRLRVDGGGGGLTEAMAHRDAALGCLCAKAASMTQRRPDRGGNPREGDSQARNALGNSQNALFFPCVFRESGVFKNKSKYKYKSIGRTNKGTA